VLKRTRDEVKLVLDNEVGGRVFRSEAEQYPCLGLPHDLRELVERGNEQARMLAIDV